jgi:hypothetical protein
LNEVMRLTASDCMLGFSCVIFTTEITGRTEIPG